MMWGYWGNEGSGGLGWLGVGLGMIFNLGVVVLIIYFVVKVFSNGGFNRMSTNAAEILKERYAKGEIDEEEYTKRMDVINKR